MRIYIYILVYGSALRSLGRRRAHSWRSRSLLCVTDGRAKYNDHRVVRHWQDAAVHKGSELHTFAKEQKKWLDYVLVVCIQGGSVDFGGGENGSEDCWEDFVFKLFVILRIWNTLFLVKH